MNNFFRANSSVFSTLFVLLLCQSCGYFGKEKDEQPLARVKGKLLYFSDIENLVRQEMSPEDSAQVISSYVHNWINEMLLLDKAELNLKDEQKDFQKQMDNYRSSLLIYEYEKKIIQQKLDTTVTLQEIEDYYFTNQQNFTLKEDAVKVTYARFSNNVPHIDRIRRVYRSEKQKDQDEFIDYCHQFALRYYDEEEWLSIDDLLKHLPLKAEDGKNVLKNNHYFEVSDSTSYYFVYVKSYKIKDSTSPLSFEKTRIKSIIINQRKLNLLKKLKLDLYNKALAKKDFEIYEQ